MTQARQNYATLTKDDVSYEDWFKAVNRCVLNKLCNTIGVNDLADFCSMDCYEEGMTAEEAANQAIEEDDMASAYLEEMGLSADEL